MMVDHRADLPQGSEGSDIARAAERRGAPPDAPLAMPAQRIERTTGPAEGWGLWVRRRATILTRPGH
jgi:hypothetical protein